jgi:radical SAM superfamily enzyme YgiQ (UPF0313 family)
MNILLIEPGYKNKYPPLGLMKISTFHKQKGDSVTFFKGTSDELRKKIWDRIYISSLFTFHFSKTIETIHFYEKSVRDRRDIFVGGVLATLKSKEIEKLSGATVVSGLLDAKGKVGYLDDDIIDYLTPDYSIIDDALNSNLAYHYPTSDSYISYSTRGCIRNCAFCAVPRIEGKFHNSYSLIDQVRSIESQYGTKRHLLLLDNNILAAKEHFFTIIDQIIQLGFGKGAKLTITVNGKLKSINRYVDFNQGVDARLLVKDKRYIETISKIAINPLRIAFDNIKDKDAYIKSVRMAAENGIKIMSNYILYNYIDTPEDFYERLKINIELNEEFKNNGFDSRVWSFPMKYSPIKGSNSKNRKYLGKHWTRKQLRGIQNILTATHGVVGPRKPFFIKAFGNDQTEFKEILMLPENYIINRNSNIINGNLEKLKELFNSLSMNELKDLLRIISSNNFNSIDTIWSNPNAQKILNLYKVKK